jgi:hypothetical protein
MSRAARGITLLLALVWPATAARGQGGLGACVPGTSPLQAAVNAAQPGDVVVVDGLSSLAESICVDKPLVLVSLSGSAAFMATSGPTGGSNGPRGVFQIAPSVSGVVAFRNLIISGVTCFATPGAVMRGIYSESPNVTLLVDGCTISGADYGCGVGDSLAHGAAGIEGSVARLVVKDSTITGGDGDLAIWGDLGCPFGPTTTAGAGGDAVNVTGEALLVRSILAGGNGGDAEGQFACCTPSLPIFATPGAGGSAVVATTVRSWGSTGTGGTGGVVRCQGTVLGQAPAGSPLAPGGISALQVGPQPSLGGTALINLQNPGGQFAAIAVGTSGFGPAIPVSGTDPYFLGPSPVIVAAGPGLTGLAIPVPNSSVLVGAVLPVQAGFQTPGGFALTNPDVVLILP